MRSQDEYTKCVHNMHSLRNLGHAPTMQNCKIIHAEIAFEAVLHHKYHSFSLTCMLDQWRSQTRAHPGLGPGISIRKTVEHRTFVVSYALLTLLFARLTFNTGEDLYCVHVCQSHGSELLPIQDQRHFKNSRKNDLSSYL